MTPRTRTRLFTAIATALPIAAMTLPAPAQTRVNQDGRARDANTQVGSDGSNDLRNGVDRRGQTYTGNQLVTGNVSGAKAFRGNVGYTDPLEFRGNLGSTQSDRFNRDASAAPTRSNPNTDYGRPTAFYGGQRATPAPAGFRQEAYTGGFYNTGIVPQNRQGSNPAFQDASSIYSSRSTALRPSGVLLDATEQDNQPQVLSASPLGGAVMLNPSMLGQATDSTPGVTPSGLQGPTGVGRRDRNDRTPLTPAEIQQMREELNGQGGDQQQQQRGQNNFSQPLASEPLDNSVGAIGETTSSPRAAAGAARNLGTGPGANDANNNAGSTGNAIDSRLNADRLGAGRNQTGQGVQRNFDVPPAQQSSQYAALQARLQQQQQAGLIGSPEQANMAERRLQFAQQAGKEGAQGQQQNQQNQQPGQPRRGALPLGGGRQAAPAGGGGAAQPAAPRTPAAQAAPTRHGANAPAGAAATPAAPRPEPLRIKSLAEGVQAKGLRDLLAGAEDLMRQGKFTSAIEKYASAEQVAPNNPLIRLGRAQAEIGASKYGSAEQHLREAVQADPALLMGQYDMESFLGRERLSFVVKDLQQLAQNEAASARPMILLAYIAYGNPGMEAAAADYLNQAAERAGRPDPLIDAMRKNWSLPGTTAQPNAAPAQSELNK